MVSETVATMVLRTSEEESHQPEVFQERPDAREASDSRVRREDVSHDRLAAGEDDALTHGQNSCGLETCQL